MLANKGAGLHHSHFRRSQVRFASKVQRYEYEDDPSFRKLGLHPFRAVDTGDSTLETRDVLSKGP